MDLFRELMGSASGLMVLLVFIFMIGMGLFIWRLLARKMRESEPKS
jgi:preprotein translocase subunit YajC